MAGNTLAKRHSPAQTCLLRLFGVWRSFFPSSFLFPERGRWEEGTRPAGWLSLAVGAVKTLQHSVETDVEQSDLVLQLFQLLLHAGATGAAAPVETHGPGHEVDGHHEAQRQHGILGLTLVLVQDVHARHGEQDDPHHPEEAAEHHVQDTEGEAQGQRQEPVGQEDDAHQQEGTCGAVGHRAWIEVLGQVRDCRTEQRDSGRLHGVRGFSASWGWAAQLTGCLCLCYTQGIKVGCLISLYTKSWEKTG